MINVDKGVDYVLSCQNYDGSFGGMPDAESHSAYVFCCVGTLAIAGCLEDINLDKLGRWLLER